MLMPTEVTPAPKGPSSILLIVLIVLGIAGLLAFLFMAFATKVVLPRLMSAGREAHESTLKSNTQQIRNAIEQFRADTGSYPVTLTDMVLPKDIAPQDGVSAGGERIPLPAGSYNGPYLTAPDGIGGIPINPFKSSQEKDYADIDAHWMYKYGIVRPTVPERFEE